MHPSNFRVTGFTAAASVAELAGLRAPLVVDIGSGLLAAHPALPDEPDAATALRAGADLVTASGDKLLGGPQAGLLLGRADLVERLRRHPLARALRVDKLTLAALEATLRGARTPTVQALRGRPGDAGRPRGRPGRDVARGRDRRRRRRDGRRGRRRGAPGVAAAQRGGEPARAVRRAAAPRRAGGARPGRGRPAACSTCARSRRRWTTGCGRRRRRDPRRPADPFRVNVTFKRSSRINVTLTRNGSR